jgi:hypothetical protein
MRQRLSKTFFVFFQSRFRSRPQPLSKERDDSTHRAQPVKKKFCEPAFSSSLLAFSSSIRIEGGGKIVSSKPVARTFRNFWEKLIHTSLPEVSRPARVTRMKYSLNSATGVNDEPIAPRQLPQFALPTASKSDQSPHVNALRLHRDQATRRVGGGIEVDTDEGWRVARHSIEHVRRLWMKSEGRMPASGCQYACWKFLCAGIDRRWCAR